MQTANMHAVVRIGAPQLTTKSRRVIIDGMEYVSVEEAAKISGYAPAYIRRLLRQGKIKADKKGTMWWVQLESLKEYKRNMDLLGSGKFNWRRDDI